jgi:hypothetical protein
VQSVPGEPYEHRKRCAGDERAEKPLNRPPGRERSGDDDQSERTLDPALELLRDKAGVGRPGCRNAYPSDEDGEAGDQPSVALQNVADLGGPLRNGAEPRQEDEDRRRSGSDADNWQVGVEDQDRPQDDPELEVDHHKRRVQQRYEDADAEAQLVGREKAD